jgi:hypothetical protein
MFHFSISGNKITVKFLCLVSLHYHPAPRPTVTGLTFILCSHGSICSSSRTSTVVVDETPRPTRFDWPEENMDTQPFSSSFDDLSYETKPLVKSSVHTVDKPPAPRVDDTTQRTATFEEVCRTASNMKRMPSSPTMHDEAAVKKAKMMDLQVT